MVYRGGLENRFGLTPDGGSNPSLSANSAERNCRAAAVAKAGVDEVAASFGSASRKEQVFL